MKIDLKKLNRRQLLELLLQQTERADNLQKQLKIAEEKLQNRVLAEAEAGSMAEAALRLTEVFEAADNAVELYVENAKKRSDGQTFAKEDIEAEARKKAEKIIADAEKKSADMIAQAKARCDSIEAEAAETLRAISDRMKLLLDREKKLVYKFSLQKGKQTDEE